VTVDLHVVEHGQAGAPAVLLAGSIGTDHGMWDAQVPSLSSRFRVLALDLRGHGASPTTPGPVAMTDLADDVLRVADRLGVDGFGFVGLSLGGAVGQLLASSYPDRVGALVLCCTSARFSEAAASWRERAARVRAEGTGWLVEASRGRWFAPGFADRRPDEADRLLGMLTATPVEGYAAACDALAGFDGRPLLGSVKAPTLVVAGAEDPATPVDMAEELTAGIDGARLLVVPGAAHLASAERPELVNPILLDHLERHLS
jgi:3-oxoadipate enol-lactonase